MPTPAVNWSEEWVADRVRWRFAQFGREGAEWTLDAAVWEAVPRGLQNEVVALASVGGCPLVLFGSSSERWTFLTSREVVSWRERHRTQGARVSSRAFERRPMPRNGPPASTAKTCRPMT